MSQTPEEQSTEPWGWTRTQRFVFGFLLLVLLGCLTVQLWRRPARVDDARVIVNGEPVTLPLRLDPNTASAEEFMRIAHLGDKAANQIIDWRIAHLGDAPNGVVFHSLEDFTQIPGLSKKNVQEMRAFLEFPDDADTQP